MAGIRIAGSELVLTFAQLSDAGCAMRTAVVSVPSQNRPIDDEGLVTLVPGAVPNASLPGGALVGLPGELVFVEEP